MTTYPWAILSAAIVATSITAATAAPPATQPVDPFVIHKAQGDKARAAKRLPEALDAYAKALAIHYDPVVAGRAGLILLARGEFDLAAQQLYRAVNDTSASLSKQDRVEFSRGYSDALQEVCRVDIKVNRGTARVEIDGVERSNGRADFWIFLKPGEHKVLAQLTGFQDTNETIVTERGRPQTLALVMQPVLDVTPSVVTTTPTVDPINWDRFESLLYVAKLPPNPLKTSTNAGFVLEAGARIPFGATPGVALGGQLRGGWRSKSWWEIGVEVRGAWTLGSAFIAPGSVFTWALTAAPCGRFPAHFFGCVLLHLERGVFHSKTVWTLPGAGFRAGYEFHLINLFYVAPFVELDLRFGESMVGWGALSYWYGNKAVPALGANVLTFF